LLGPITRRRSNRIQQMMTQIRLVESALGDVGTQAAGAAV
jgi:hypothetical protein